MILVPAELNDELMANANLIRQTLAQFDIEVSLGEITKGSAITRYELYPAPGVKLEAITALSNNITAALKAERIDILAPVPGKRSVGVDVPNSIKTKVVLRDLFESNEWNNTKARIPLGLGKDLYGRPVIADLAEMPHLLIAGSASSGKSVCIHSIIASLLYRFSPDQLRFIMMDPKVVELQRYNALPHLVMPVVSDPKKISWALRRVINEMEDRFQILAKTGVRDIRSFNERPKKETQPKQEPKLPGEEIIVRRKDEFAIPEFLSHIVIIIDELAGLMLLAPAEVEMAIARITQMAHSAGIHCIIATGRPSVDVVTSLIKANIPARIAFHLPTRVDSRTILDAMGADKLLGKGDMLYLPPGSASLTRAQGTLVTDEELRNVVDFIARQGRAWPGSTALAGNWACPESNMSKKKFGVADELREKYKHRLVRAEQELKADTSESHKASVRLGSVEWREAEERKLLAASKQRLPELKALLAFASDHWHYEDPVYRFYHHSFKVHRAQATTLKIVRALRALAPHLDLNPDFTEIVAASTKAPSGSSGVPGGPDPSRAVIEALFHARHVLEMLCKYAEELSAPPAALPSGWATVLYLYNIR